MNMICQGTVSQLVALARVGGGTPTSPVCLNLFLRHWVSWAGDPRSVVVDRGLHNRGVFARHLAAHGVQIRQIGLEVAEQLGRTERHGGIFKNLFDKVCRDQSVAGEEDVTIALAELSSVKNSNYRRGGYAPQQWVTGRLVREPGTMMDEEEHTDLGALELTASDGVAPFSRNLAIRSAARIRFAKLDCSARSARALLRKAAPLPGHFDLGDIVSYRRRSRVGEHGTQWSPASRVIGKEGTKSLWVSCEGVLVLVATDKCRPCTAAEALAYQYLGTRVGQPPLDEPPEGGQQAYVDEREPVHDSDRESDRSDEEHQDSDHGEREDAVGPEQVLLPVPFPAPVPQAGEPRVPVSPVAPEIEPATLPQPDEPPHPSPVPMLIGDDPVESAAKRRRLCLDDVPRSVRRRLEDSVGGQAGSASSSTIPPPRNSRGVATHRNSRSRRRHAIPPGSNGCVLRRSSAGAHLLLRTQEEGEPHGA